MDADLIALKLVLDELHERDDISTKSDRVRVQKAIYLAQTIGVNLGYSYSWYLRGPYSTGLTKDYYQLNEDKAAGDQSYKKMALNDAVKTKLSMAAKLMAIPQGVIITREHWYELLASLHYLIKSSGYTYENACEYLRSVKPHLAGFFDVGKQRLKEFNLV